MCSTNGHGCVIAILGTSEITISEIALYYEIEPTQLYVLAVRGPAQLEMARGLGAVTCEACRCCYVVLW